MVIIIGGASHTGKTLLAQKLMEKYKYPYLSIDHLKMGLIRSGKTRLNPCSDGCDLTAYLWPIVREMIKTVIENRQNLIVEGCYIPYFYLDFPEEYLREIKCFYLAMTKRYIEKHFTEIKEYADEIEIRLDDSYYTMEEALDENEHIYWYTHDWNADVIWIDGEYNVFEEAVRRIEEIMM